MRKWTGKERGQAEERKALFSHAFSSRNWTVEHMRIMLCVKEQKWNKELKLIHHCYYLPCRHGGERTPLCVCISKRTSPTPGAVVSQVIPQRRLDVWKDSAIWSCSVSVWHVWIPRSKSSGLTNMAFFALIMYNACVKKATDYRAALGLVPGFGPNSNLAGAGDMNFAAGGSGRLKKTLRDRDAA